MITGHPLRSASSALVCRRGSVVSSLAELTAVLGAWHQRYRYRRELARVMRSGLHLIVDIGLSREQAAREVAKPFWCP
jgi:uncharacterized protein YjiS (DUF1127 family)